MMHFYMIFLVSSMCMPAYTLTDTVFIGEEYKDFTIGCTGTFHSVATGLTYAETFDVKYWAIDGVSVYGFSCDQTVPSCSPFGSSSPLATVTAVVGTDSVNSTLRYTPEKLGNFTVRLQSVANVAISNEESAKTTVCEDVPNTVEMSSNGCMYNHYNCSTEFSCQNGYESVDGWSEVTAICLCNGNWSDVITCQVTTTTATTSASTLSIATEASTTIMNNDSTSSSIMVFNTTEGSKGPATTTDAASGTSTKDNDNHNGSTDYSNLPTYKAAVAAVVIYPILGIGFWSVYVMFYKSGKSAKGDKDVFKILIAMWSLTLVTWAIGIGLGFGRPGDHAAATAGDVLAFLAIGCEIAVTVTAMVKANQKHNKVHENEMQTTTQRLKSDH